MNTMRGRFHVFLAYIFMQHSCSGLPLLDIHMGLCMKKMLHLDLDEWLQQTSSHIKHSGFFTVC
jgi:hypothetical protein